MTEASLRRRLAMLFVVAGVVTALLTTLITVAMVRLDRATDDQVNRYGPALLQTQVLARAFSDQETGLRGYLAGGREDFLEPYEQGQADEGAAVARLQRLLEGRPDLLARLEDVETEAQQWRRDVAGPAIREVRGAGEAPSAAQVERAKTEFDEVRAALGELRRPVRAERDAATSALFASGDRLRDALLLSLLLLVLLAAFTWRSLRRWVVLPLHRLGSEVERVEEGDLSRKVDVQGAPAEIAELAAQVERMRMRIVQEYGLAERSRDEAQEAQLLVEEQADDLRRSNAELEQFAYVASHDLQEPLRKVASFCQLLERRYKGQLDERGDQYIEFAVDGAKRMQRLINDLLAFSRVGRMSAELEPVDLDTAFDQAVRQLDEVAADTGARLTRDGLPTVAGDPSLLVQLFQNLLSNGMKFRRDGVAPQVHVTAGRVDDEWQLTCRDNGIGIEPQYAEKIFVIFQRLHSREAYGGTGIGLAMCRKIVEHHGGRMWLDEDGTDGATFHWTLPVMGDTAGTHVPADEERKRTDDGDASEPAGHGAARGGRPG